MRAFAVACGDAESVSISSEHPVSADQIYRALVALGAEPLFDPEMRPEGPQDEDRRRLLGALLAKVELEITAATRLGNDEDEGEVLLGWIEEAGPDSGMTNNVLINRLHRTGVQLLGLDEDETFPGQSAASMAIVVSADTFGAHLRFQDGDVEGVRSALGRAEVSVIEVQQSMHDLRVAIGDAEEEEE
ncbi:hypothetical protein OG978_01200 [Streptomyces sp. NBC_01591]|uniref:hypothetical protein n=1 Tax=Streptomyces sp. NBC_01591 TaxID=2975888 RepID=UPI002DDC3048|nr:hypothetical protein [Streptomyces sp. NBC_01591]WSD66176.1 hypothetical protein OG978_01200 [Streptomyces sp. NBC_01591]